MDDRHGELHKGVYAGSVRARLLRQGVQRRRLEPQHLDVVDERLQDVRRLSVFSYSHPLVPCSTAERAAAPSGAAARFWALEIPPSQGCREKRTAPDDSPRPK